jgi:UDP-glucuronate 4-epimerase
MVVVTGCAGFVGFHVSMALLRRGETVLGIDNLSDYYSVALKQWRLRHLQAGADFIFYECDIADELALQQCAALRQTKSCIHLAAQAGVRHSVQNPQSHVVNNVLGTTNILEAARAYEWRSLVVASTSSVYANQKSPFREDVVDLRPISPYSASKLCCEVMVDAWRRTHDIPASVVRFFTVYGPAGRPDMSVFRFIENTITGRTITVYGDGKQRRDFTYVDDIVAGVLAAHANPAVGIVNLGGERCYPLNVLLDIVEQAVGKRHEILHLDPIACDMRETLASTDKAADLLGWKAQVGLAEGIARTVNWHVCNRNVLQSIIDCA